MKALIDGGTDMPGGELLANLSEAAVLSREPARTSDLAGALAEVMAVPQRTSA